MIVRRIRLQNLGPFDRAEVALVPGVVGVFGRSEVERRSNGTGKSTLVESVPFALFGQSERGQLADVRRRGARLPMVSEVAFEVGNRSYVVCREWKRGTRLSWSIDGEVCEGSVPDVQRDILRTLGLSYRTFLASAFFLQGEADMFTSASSAARLEYLREILELSFWDRCRQLAADGAKLAAGNQTRLDSAIDEVGRQVEDLGGKVGGMSAERRKIELRDLERRLERAEDERTELLRREQEVGSSERRLRELHRAMDDLEESKSRDQENLEWARRKIARLEAPVVMYAGVDRMLPAFDERYEARDRKLHLLRHALGEHQDFLDRDIDGVCPTCRRPISGAELRPLKDRAREDAEGVARQIEMVEAELGALRERRARWRKAADANIGSREELRAREDLPELRAQCARLRARIEETDQRCQELLEEAGLIDLQVRGLDELRDQLASANAERDRLRAQANEIRSALKMHAELKAQLKQAKDRLRGLRADREKQEADRTVYASLTEAFGKSGVPLYVVRRAVDHELSRNTNDVLGEVLPGHVVHYEFREGSRDNLEILVERGGHFRRYETFSGGERLLLNFSIRMALSRLLRNRSVGLPISMVVLDEVFGALDQENRGRLEAALMLLRREFAQVFVISHQPIDLPLDQTVVVERQGATSSVRSA